MDADLRQALLQDADGGSLNLEISHQSILVL